MLLHQLLQHKGPQDRSEYSLDDPGWSSSFLAGQYIFQYFQGPKGKVGNDSFLIQMNNNILEPF